MIKTISPKYVLAAILLVAGNPFIMHAAADGPPPSPAEFLAQGGEPKVRLPVPDRDGTGGHTDQTIRIIPVLQRLQDELSDLSEESRPFTVWDRVTLNECMNIIEKIQDREHPAYRLNVDQLDIQHDLEEPFRGLLDRDIRGIAGSESIFPIWQISILTLRACELALSCYAQKKSK